MAVLDSYSEANRDANKSISGGLANQRRYAAFDSGAGGELDLAQFFLIRLGTPTGSVYARIYAHSGTYGTSGIPTGSALAESDPIDVTTISDVAHELKTFLFSGVNRIALAPATNYCLSVEFTGGDGSNGLRVGVDSSSPSHAGNSGDFGSGSWTVDAASDTCFYVNGVSVVAMKRVAMPAAAI